MLSTGDLYILALSTIFFIVFWNCSDSVVFFVFFYFITIRCSSNSLNKRDILIVLLSVVWCVVLCLSSSCVLCSQLCQCLWIAGLSILDCPFDFLQRLFRKICLCTNINISFCKTNEISSFDGLNSFSSLFY